MRTEPRHRYFNIPLSEWIDRTPNELDVDAVGLWQLVSVGSEDFNLSEDDLKIFIERCIVSLVKYGAKPVFPSRDEGKYWDYQAEFGENPEDIAHNFVEAFVLDKKLSSEDGLWFSLH